MTYIRGDVAQYDAWESLGNPGWNWASLLPYFKLSEKYIIPRATQLAAGVTYEAVNHGFSGHVHVGYQTGFVNGSFAPPVIGTWGGPLALPHNPDLNSGDVRGFAMGPQTLDPELNIRWDAARAYLYPIEGRSNLKIIQGTVKRITWAPRGEGRLVANGVEYLTDDGMSHTLNAQKEVVVSAGAVRTPLVLEGSGIGNPRFNPKFNLDWSPKQTN
jgi:choline dehydrogenase